MSKEDALEALLQLEKHVPEMREYPVWVDTIRAYLEEEQ